MDRGAWTAKTVKRPRQQPAHPQYADYWAPLTRKRHIPPHPAQPRHTNDGAPRTRKRHQQEHRPQRPTERSEPTPHAKGRTGDRPGPRKGATTRRNVTRGVWDQRPANGGGIAEHPPPTVRRPLASPRTSAEYRTQPVIVLTSCLSLLKRSPKSCRLPPAVCLNQIKRRSPPSAEPPPGSAKEFLRGPGRLLVAEQVFSFFFFCYNTSTSNRHRSPSNRRRLPSNRRRLPSNPRRLPSNRHRLPSNRRRLPSNRRRLPSNRRRLPSNRRRLPSNRRRLPSNRRRLPCSIQHRPSQPKEVAERESAAERDHAAEQQQIAAEGAGARR